MSFFAFALVIAAAFSHAFWNFLVKRLEGGPELIWLFSVVSAVLYLPLAAIIYYQNAEYFGWTEFGFCVISAVIHMGYFLLLQQGYRRGDLSLVYPTARATGPVLSTAFAVMILGEHLSPLIIAGGVAIIVGVIFLTGGFSRAAKDMKVSLLFGLGAGFLIGSYTVWDAYSVSALLIPPLLLDYISSLGRMVFLAPVAIKRRHAVVRHWRQHTKAVLGIAIFNPLAYILVLTALVTTPVVYVAPAREVSVLITVLMGTILLKEGSLKNRLGWGLLIFAGMVLLGLG